jgi:hypothetical protein
LDIRCVQRDRKGEPIDPVLAAADGTVAYVNLKPSLSNYGNYIVVRHVIDRIEIHTLYAHLGSVVPGLKAGQAVKAGERLATMGRTSNTRQRITQDRAHLHFEICFRAGQNYSAWHRKFQVGTRNDHGEFNGRNFLGIDPATVLLAAQQGGTNFSLARHLAMQPEMVRVFVRDPRLSWVSRFPGLVQRKVAAEKVDSSTGSNATRRLSFAGSWCTRTRPSGRHPRRRYPGGRTATVTAWTALCCAAALPDQGPTVGSPTAGPRTPRTPKWETP